MRARYFSTLILVFTLLLTVCVGGVGWAQTIDWTKPFTMARMNVTTVGGGGPSGGGPSGYLLTATFEGSADGTDLDAITPAWTEVGTTSNGCEVDTAVYYAGSASAKLDWNSGIESSYYRTFTQQTGTFVISFRLQISADTYRDRDFLKVSLGAADWDGETIALQLRIDGSLNFKYRPAGGYTTFWAAPGITNGQWYYVEIELNASTNAVNIWVDGTQRLTGGTFSFAVDPDRITLLSGGADGGGQVYIDDLYISSGAR